MSSRKTSSYIVRVGALKIDRNTDLKRAWEIAEKPVEEAVKKIVAECESSGKNFVDTSFGPQKKHDPDGALAFYGDGKPPNANYADPAQCDWVRPRWAKEITTIDSAIRDDLAEDSDTELSDQESVLTQEDEEDATLAIGNDTGPWFCDEGSLFRDGVNANDVIQGRLGDCWLLSGMSVLASRVDLLANVFWRSSSKECEAKMRKYGFRVCRFFKDHEWYFVIIDDRLPVFAKSGKPVFAHCKDRNELWVSLLEKAYAKLHGSYDALIGGYVDGALRDLTGLACEELVLRKGHVGFHPKYAAWLQDGTLWARCKEYANDWGCMMGCSIQPDPQDLKAGKVEQKVGDTGLMSRHAYAIVDADTVRTKEHGEVKLVRLRNPWGFGEWTGPWSDASDEFKRNKKELQRVFGRPVCEREGIQSTSLPVDSNARDGTFFMTWEDWKKYFTVFFAAVDFLPSWSGQRVWGAWSSARSNAGGNHTCKTWFTNPKHRFRVLEPNTRVFIQLNQQDPRRKHGRAQAQMQKPLSFHVLAVADIEAAGGSFPTAPPSTIPGTSGIEQPPYKRHLSIDIDIRNLAQGDYVIVPSTFAPGQDGKYALQIYASKPIAVENGELIAEEEEYDNTEHVQIEFRRASIATEPASRHEIAALQEFEAHRQRLVERAKEQGVSFASLAASFAGRDRIDWKTWADTLRSVGIEPSKTEFRVFSGADDILDASELGRLVEAERVEQAMNGVTGDEHFAPVEGDESIPRAPTRSPHTQSKLLRGLVSATKALQAENDDLRAELDTVREEQARMMNVLLLYGKMLKCYDGEVHKPEALLRPSERKMRQMPDLDALLRDASAAAATGAPTRGASYGVEKDVPRRLTNGTLRFGSAEEAGLGDEFLAVKPWLGAVVPPTHAPSGKPRLDKGIELDWVYGYNATARKAVFSNAKGQLVYFAAALGVIFNAESHTQKYFGEHTDDICCMDVDATGTRAVTGQLGKKPFACIWDAVTGDLVCRLDAFAHKRQISRVKFSCDGAQVLTVGGDDNHSLALFCAKTGKLLKSVKGNKADCFFVEHNGERFITGGQKYMVSLDPQLKEKRAVFGKKGGGTPAVMTCSALLADDADVAAGKASGAMVATGTVDGRILLWTSDFKCVEAVAHAKAGKAPVDVLKFMNGRLCSAARDGSLKHWKVDGTTLVEDSVAKFDHPVRALAGNFVALGDGSIQLEGKAVVSGHARGELWGLASHPSSSCVVTTGDDAVLRVWHTKNHAQTRETQLPAPSRAAAWSPDGATLAIGLADNLVMLLDADTLKVKVKATFGRTASAAAAAKSKSKVRPSAITCLSFSPDGKTLVAGSNDCKVYVMDAKTLKKKAVFKASTSSISHLDFTTCSAYLRTNDSSYELLFYNIVTKSQETSASRLKDKDWHTTTCPLTWETQGVWPPEADGTDINACARFTTGSSPADPSYLATSDDFGKVTIYPYPFPERDEAQSASGRGHASHVTNVAHAGGQTLISTGGNDRTVMQWSIV